MVTSRRPRIRAFAVAALMVTWGGTRAAHAALTNAQMVDLLKQVDEPTGISSDLNQYILRALGPTSR